MSLVWNIPLRRGLGNKRELKGTSAGVMVPIVFWDFIISLTRSTSLTFKRMQKNERNLRTRCIFKGATVVPRPFHADIKLAKIYR